MTPSAEPTSQRAEAAAHLVPLDLLQDGEIVILAVKPSGWFVLVASLPVLGAAAVVAAVAYVLSVYHPPLHERVIWSGCAAAGLARMVVACCQWLGRTYVLTNRRIVCIRGLLRVQWLAVGLSELREALLAPSIPERLVGAGSIYCLAASESPAAMAWQTVARPAEVHEIILDAIGRSRRRNVPSAGGP